MTGDDGELSSVRRGGKSEAAFRTISEVADDLDVPQHVLRFWEGKFPQVKPLKRGGGRRYYRPDDVVLLRRIRDLLYSEGYTIKGVQKLLKEGGAAGRPAEAEAQLGLQIRDPDPPSLFVDDMPEDEGEDMSDDEPAGGESDEGEGHSGDLSVRGVEPSLRRELEGILAELEQLRGLLQPR